MRTSGTGLSGGGWAATPAERCKASASAGAPGIAWTSSLCRHRLAAGAAATVAGVEIGKLRGGGPNVGFLLRVHSLEPPVPTTMAAVAATTVAFATGKGATAAGAAAPAELLLAVGVTLGLVTGTEPGAVEPVLLDVTRTALRTQQECHHVLWGPSPPHNAQRHPTYLARCGTPPAKALTELLVEVLLGDSERREVKRSGDGRGNFVVRQLPRRLMVPCA